MPAESLAAWAPALVRLHVGAGAVLLAAGRPYPCVYLPLTAVVAQMHETASDQTLCLSLIGRHGMVGSSAALSAQPADSSFVVVAAGEVLRLDLVHLRTQMDRVGATRRRVLDYVASQIGEIARTAVCSRHTAVDPHLCTRLLQLFSEAQAEALPLTQEDLGQLVGVRRERVNQLIREMQAAGLVEARRGALRLLDRPGLLQRVCGCHAPLMRARQG